ncbi:MAG: alpha/beta hydrolase [Paracoccaceae bacterium]|nr:alpha/beta hydrolase [Paracoccaceae bacterium]
MSTRHYGHGPLNALALHCSLAHAGEWAGIGAALAESVTLTCCDLIGHGTAPDWQPGTEPTESSEAIALAALPGERVDVIGHSFGAVVALRLALNHPDRVRRLVLIEPTLFAAARAAGSPEVAPHLTAHTDFAQAIAAGEAERAAALFTADWGTGEDWARLPERQRRYISERIHLIPAANPALMEDCGGLLAPGRLEGLSCPVLLIEGGASPAIVPAIAAALAARLPQARRAVVAGAGHMLPVTHVEEVAGEIGRFLTA